MTTTSLAIVPAPSQAPVLIKPYCGAKRGVAPSNGNAQVEIFKAPVPAWADVGVVCHMQQAVVPEEVKPGTGVEHLKPRFQASRCLFRFSVVLLAVLENVFCYLAFLEVSPPEDTFYNKFEAHMLGYAGLDMILLVFAVLNTVYIFIFWMVIGLIRLDLYGSMVTGRLLVSLPSGGICAALVFFGEGAKLFPFCCAVCAFLHLLVWMCERIWPKERKPHKAGQMCCKVFAFLVIGWFISFIVMFFIESADYLRDSACPATTNTAMPVRIKGIHNWQCVKWGQTHYIRRVTSPGQPVVDALCSTSFYAFSTIVNVTTGEQLPSSHARSLRCPAHCQDLGLGNSVIGCEVYHASSSICSAAVQMGILAANKGGLVKVVGRAPPPLIAGKYERCNKHGILSSETPPLVSKANPAWAFYFQVEGMESLDMVTMHSWKRVSTPGAQEPWKSYAADVTWVVGGASQRREVVLGPGGANSDIELNFCEGSASCP